MQEIQIPTALKPYTDKFCSVCGSKLVVTDKKRYDFDSETGKPEFIYTIQCPKKSFFNILAMHEKRKYLVCVPVKLHGSNKMHTTVLEQEIF